MPTTAGVFSEAVTEKFIDPVRLSFQGWAMTGQSP